MWGSGEWKDAIGGEELTLWDHCNPLGTMTSCRPRGDAKPEESLNIFLEVVRFWPVHLRRQQLSLSLTLDRHGP